MVISTVKRHLPRPLFEFLKPLYHRLQNARYRIFGRALTQGETAKARARRERENFFELYCTGKGLDIGHGGDPVVENCSGWESEDGDAQYLKGIPKHSLDFVYSSHTLEHMIEPETAIRCWWSVLRPGGHLLLYIPHRDLYEKKLTLPSRWNSDHKHFFLPDRDDPPDTLGLKQLLIRSIPDHEVVYLKTCDDGFVSNGPDEHSSGEYSIECVVRKPTAC